MESEEIAVVLLADLVAGKDDNILRIVALNKGNVLIDCIGRSLVPVRAGGLLIGRQYMDSAVETIQIPWLSVAYVLVQNQWLILGKDPYRINP